MNRLAVSVVFGVALAATSVACGGRTVRTPASSPAVTDVSPLWQEPRDLDARDLFAGPGGEALMPGAGTIFTFVEADRSGFSPGYDVRGPDGMTWSVKLGPEAQTEVVASRILWAIGYHQVPTYYLPDWTMTGGPEGDPGPARLRPDLPAWDAADEWAWEENPFVTTQAFKGLIVANVMMNGWDWKASNNRIYEVTRPDGGIERRYVVRDLGATFGKTSSPPVLEWLGSRIAQGNRNDLEDFEAQGFIERVEGDRVEFDYDGIYGHVVDLVRTGDVVWASRLLARLSDEQWRDAFRAGGYAPEQAARYIAKMKSKIADGLALADRSAAQTASAAVE
jgi:hypothetical protein